MSTAKPTGIKVPSKIAKPPGTTAPKTNPTTGKNLPMCCSFNLCYTCGSVMFALECYIARGLMVDTCGAIFFSRTCRASDFI